MGLLARPSRGPKLPDLECAALLSLPPPADCPGCIPCCLAGCSYGVTWLPIGVARCRVGRGGLAGGWIVRLPTGLAFGDGGMARPSLGAARPRLPGMAGRRRGAGEFIIGTDIGVDAGVGRAEEEEETGWSWTAGSVPWDCEGVASAMVSSAGQGSLSQSIQTSELLMVVRWQGDLCEAEGRSGTQKKNTPNGQAGTEYKIGHGRKKEGVSQQRSDKSSAK